VTAIALTGALWLSGTFIAKLYSCGPQEYHFLEFLLISSIRFKLWIYEEHLLASKQGFSLKDFSRLPQPSCCLSFGDEYFLFTEAHSETSAKTDNRSSRTSAWRESHVHNLEHVLDF